MSMLKKSLSGFDRHYVRLAAMIFLALALSLALTQTALAGGTWRPTNPIDPSREDHKACLLSNGKVLVTGGYNSRVPLDSVKLYDPATKTWNNAASLHASTARHTITRLSNGKVLVVGGVGSSNRAELYDPVLNIWTETPTLAFPREDHTATLLPNGKVLVAGGSGTNKIAEIYDPTVGAIGTWSLAGSLAKERSFHTATLLPNGKVLVVGGLDSGNVSLASVELYDPTAGATGTWSSAGTLATARDSHTDTLLGNGQVLVAGGFNNVSNGPVNPAELYDPAIGTTGTWSLAASLATARDSHTATLLGNGQVLVAGGFESSGAALNSAELYNPAKGVWSPTGSLATGRYYHTATLLVDGQVLVVGGGDGADTLASAELYQDTPTPVSFMMLLLGE